MEGGGRCKLPDSWYLVQGIFLAPNGSISNITGSYFGYPDLKDSSLFAFPKIINYADSEIVMVDGTFGTTLSNKIGHGTTLGRPFQGFRPPTKIL